MVCHYVIHTYRYWKESPSFEQLKNWLSDKDTAKLHGEDDGNSVITVHCGDLMCKFGVKTYSYTGYVHRKSYACSKV